MGVETITTVLAVYGALLSSATLWLHQKDKKQNIKVKLSMGFVGDPIKGVSDNLIFIEALNVGSVASFISGYSFVLPDGQQLVSILDSDKKIPCKLEPGETVQVWIAMKKLAQHLKNNGYDGKIKIKGQFRNKVGVRFKSDKLLFNINEHLKV